MFKCIFNSNSKIKCVFNFLNINLLFYTKICNKNIKYICKCILKDDDMNTRKRLKKFISCIRCVINKLKRFSIEMEDEYDIEDDETWIRCVVFCRRQEHSWNSYPTTNVSIPNRTCDISRYE